MFTDIFFNIIHDIWPMLFIFTVIIVSIRLMYLIYNKQRIILYKEVLMLCFIIYILLLYYIVTFQDNNYGTNNFIPFKEIFRYKIDSKLFIKNVVGNILLFVPFGLFVTHYVQNKKIYPTLFLSILISSLIEYVQSLIGRTADIDDVILNTVGGLLGYFIYKSWDKIVDKLPSFMKKQVFLDMLLIIIIIFVLYLAFKFDFWRFIV